jgi:hypothetical protein
MGSFFSPNPISFLSGQSEYGMSTGDKTQWLIGRGMLLSFAYPYDQYQCFSVLIHEVIEADIIACRTRRVISDADMAA